MSINSQTLKKYINDNFIETGSSLGDGIQLALDCGFKNIYSIEIKEESYNHCKERFRNNDNVHLYLGDSAEQLPLILEKINKKSTFWLDAHLCGGRGIRGKINCPILTEIELILKNNLNHYILIDDRRLFIRSKKIVGYTSHDNIINKIKEFNSEPIIKFENGKYKRDITVYSGK